MSADSPQPDVFQNLRRFMRSRPKSAEQCGLCGAPVGERHPHLLELKSRKMVCGCDACAILFADVAAGSYRRIPAEIQSLPDFAINDSQWDGLSIPINMAFFCRDGAATEASIFYPSPAGATRAHLDLESWQQIVAENPVLERMQADVEALLVNRVTHPHEYYIVPIDECYRLVGLIRTKWHGFSGGKEAWRAVGEFSCLSGRAQNLREARPSMPDLSFRIEGAEPVPYAATPMLALKVRLTSDDPAAPIQNVLLQCQVQIEPARRRYQPTEQEQLRDLFGEPSRWSQTLRPMLWTNACVVIPAFRGEPVADVTLPCTFDFTVAATKYFHGIEGGEIPICVLFSGTIFYATPEGSWQVQKISWAHEANYRLPARTWKAMMDLYYPNTAWLCLRQDVFDELHRFKVSRSIPTWEEAFQKMLAGVEENDLRKVRA